MSTDIEEAKNIVDELGEKIEAARNDLLTLEYKQYDAGVRLELLKFCGLPDCAHKWLMKRQCILSIVAEFPHDSETYVRYDVTMSIGKNYFRQYQICPVHGPLSLRHSIKIKSEPLSVKTKTEEEAQTYVTGRLDQLHNPIADPEQPITETVWNNTVSKLKDDDIEFLLCMRMFQSAQRWLEEEEGNDGWSAVEPLSDLVFSSDELE